MWGCGRSSYFTLILKFDIHCVFTSSLLCVYIFNPVQPLIIIIIIIIEHDHHGYFVKPGIKHKLLSVQEKLVVIDMVDTT
jgi:hypothetical protein